MHNHSAIIVDGSFGGRFSVSRRPWMLLVIATVLLVGAATRAVGGPITTVPTSLSPGDPYRLAFVTSTTRDGTSNDIGVYNAFVDALGDTVIASDWRAIASTLAVDARVNTGTLPVFAGGSSGVPVFLLNDTKLADDNDDLWSGGGIDTPLQFNELGDLVTTLTVWTGTAQFGNVASQFGTDRGLGAVTDFAATGQIASKNPQWINFPPALITTALSEKRP